MRNIISSAKRLWVNSRLYFEAKRNDFDPEENLLIFSGPRGGSTWITELISTIPNTAVLWEPLHLRVKTFRDLNFSWRQYIPENEAWREAEDAFEMLFRGKIVNSWICSRSSVESLKKAERLIVKFCRANTLLPWLINKFKFHYQPIYLVRHPFAVVSSQLKHGAWDDEFSGFKIPNCPYNELYVSHARFLSRMKTKEEALTASWCLTNLVPLRHEHNNKKWITIYYENLITNPEAELSRIFHRWNVEMPDGMTEKVRKASSTTKDATFRQSIEMQLRKWQGTLTQDQITRMVGVLDYFGVADYDNTNVFPLVSC